MNLLKIGFRKHKNGNCERNNCNETDVILGGGRKRLWDLHYLDKNESCEMILVQKR
jgi:hypothetical protein